MLTKALQRAMKMPRRAETKNMRRNWPREYSRTIPWLLTVLFAWSMIVLGVCVCVCGRRKWVELNQIL